MARRLAHIVAAVCLVIKSAAIDPPIFLDHGIAPGTSGCTDNDAKCTIWANQGECESNGAWMMANCRRSCQSCQGGERAWKLRSHIAKEYDNSTAVNAHLVNNVEVESLHVDHIEVDELDQTALIHGRLVLTWNDSRLVWDKEQWGVSWLNFYWIQIWTPKLIQRNEAGKLSETTSKWRTLAANYTGQVYMWIDFSFKSACPFDYSKFPGDSQQCCFPMDDKRYYIVHFNVSENARATAKRSIGEAHAAGWSIDEISVDSNRYTVRILADWDRDPYDVSTTNCEICIKMKRRSSYLSAEIIGPCVATALVTLTSFLVISLRQQLWMLVASLAMQILSLQTLNQKLPPASAGVPLLVSFYSVNLALTCLILVLVTLLHLWSSHRSAKPVPRVMDKVLSFLSKCFPCIDDAENLQNDQKALDTVSESGTSGRSGGLPGCPWAPFVQAIRFLLFLSFLAIYIFAMIACLRL